MGGEERSAPRPRRWTVRRGDPAREAVLVREIGASAFLARLLANRGIVEPEAAVSFLDASLSRTLRSPMLFKEMRRAAGRVLEAVRNGEGICIYGDYDVDGITATTELLVFLRSLGVEAEVHIPHRMRDGYGLRADALQAIAARGRKVVVTVDCGAAAHAELAAAAAAGLDVVVCDHHQAPERRPPAFAVLNPVVADAGFPFGGLCAAGVAFYLLMGIRMLLRESGHPGPDLRRYLDLVALGTVADLVPIVEENRALVKHGLREVASTDRLGIRALCRVAGIDAVSVGSLGFGLGPRLNASGRVADAASAVELLSCTDAARARALAATLDSLNRDRREIEDVIFAEAEAMIRSMTNRDGRRTFVLASEGWHAGVVGIVASRLVERYARPVVLLAKEGELCRGSARGIDAVHLFESLRGCASLLERFGGHRMAAGLTLRAAALDAFREKFEEFVSAGTSDDDFVPQTNVDAVVTLDELTPERIDELERLEPHGPGNPRPVFLAARLRVIASRVVGDRHLKLVLGGPEGSRTWEAIGFRMADRVVETGDSIDAVFSPVVSSWEGRARLELELRDFRESGSVSTG